MIRLVRLLPALGWASLIFWISSQSNPPGSQLLFEGADKVIHASVFALLAGLCFWGAKPARTLSLGVLTLLLAAYGFSDELHQAFVPGRDASVLDFLADLSGILLVSAYFLKKLRAGDENA